jgi:hypothetical protein
MIALFDKLAAFFGREAASSVDPMRIRRNSDSNPLIVGSFGMDGSDSIGSVQLPTGAIGSDEIEPWGPGGTLMSPRGNPLRDASGNPIV